MFQYIQVQAIDILMRQLHTIQKLESKVPNILKGFEREKKNMLRRKCQHYNADKVAH